jgi:serine/threonine protein kinase
MIYSQKSRSTSLKSYSQIFIAFKRKISLHPTKFHQFLRQIPFLLSKFQPFTEEKEIPEKFHYLFSNPFPNYTFKSFIGEGSFGSCFLVHSHVYNEDFVAKVLVRNKDEKASNHPEICHITSIDNHYVVRAYDYFEDDKFLFLILEYCSFGPVINVLQNSSNEVLLRVFYQILQGVDAIHKKNIAHRDIKPSNILCDQYGRPKIIDFGISISNVNKTTLNSGTKPYQPPEHYLKVAHNPFKADIWSLGVTFYFLAFKYLPWPKSDIEKMTVLIEYGAFEIPVNTYPAISTLIKAMIVADPSERSSCEKLLKYNFFESFKDTHDLSFSHTYHPRRSLVGPNQSTPLIHFRKASTVNNYV